MIFQLAGRAGLEPGRFVTEPHDKPVDFGVTEQFVPGVIVQRQLLLIEYPMNMAVTGTADPQNPIVHLFPAEQLFNPGIAMPGTWNQMVPGQTEFSPLAQLTLFWSGRHGRYDQFRSFCCAE